MGEVSLRGAQMNQFVNCRVYFWNGCNYIKFDQFWCLVEEIQMVADVVTDLMQEQIVPMRIIFD